MKKFFCWIWFSSFYIVDYHAATLSKLPANIWIWNKDLEEFVNSNKQNFTNYQVESEKQKDFYCSLKDFNIQVVAHNMDPYIKSQPNSSDIDGFLGDMWNIMEEFLHFNSNLTVIEEFEPGRKMIKSNDTDVYLAALVYTAQTTNMYFSQPYFQNWYHLYFNLPEGKPPTYLHFQAFTGQLWAHLMLFFGFLTVMLWFTSIILGKIAPKAEVRLSMPTCFLGVISAFLNTGFDLKLKSYTARVQITIALFFGVVCYYALSASLVANLAVLDRPKPFNTLEDLAYQKTYSLCMRNNSFVYDNFSYKNLTILPKWRKIVNTVNCPGSLHNWSNWTHIQERICKGNVAVLENRIVMGLVVENPQCPVTMLSQKYFATSNYVVFSKKFKQRKALSIMMLRIRSTGIAKKLESKWVKSEVPRPPSKTKVNQITFSHIQGLLIIYLVLLGISLFILVIEISIGIVLTKWSRHPEQSEPADLLKVKMNNINNVFTYNGIFRHRNCWETCMWDPLELLMYGLLSSLP